MSKPAISVTPHDQPWDWNLFKLFIRRCREKGAKKKISDSTGISLSGNDLLLRTLVLKRVLEREASRTTKSLSEFFFLRLSQERS